MATDTMAMHLLQRLLEHQSEMLAIQLHQQDLAMNTDSIELAYEDVDKEVLEHHPDWEEDHYYDFNIEWAWNDLLPCVRAEYRRRARNLIAERSFEE